MTAKKVCDKWSEFSTIAAFTKKNLIEEYQKLDKLPYISNIADLQSVLHSNEQICNNTAMVGKEHSKAWKKAHEEARGASFNDHDISDFLAIAIFMQYSMLSGTIDEINSKKERIMDCGNLLNRNTTMEKNIGEDIKSTESSKGIFIQEYEVVIKEYDGFIKEYEYFNDKPKKIRNSIKLPTGKEGLIQEHTYLEDIKPEQIAEFIKLLVEKIGSKDQFEKIAKIIGHLTMQASTLQRNLQITFLELHKAVVNQVSTKTKDKDIKKKFNSEITNLENELSNTRKVLNVALNALEGASEELPAKEDKKGKNDKKGKKGKK